MADVRTNSEWQDESFYNIGVRPTSEDLGRGARINGIPLSFTQQAIEGYRLPFAVLRPDPEFPGQLPINNRASTAGKFKVPGLRNVELTGPYFHNGGQATLAQVLELYDRKGDFSDQNVEDIDGPLTAVALGVGDEDALIALTPPRSVTIRANSQEGSENPPACHHIPHTCTIFPECSSRR